MKTYCIDWFEQELCECDGSDGYLVRAEDHERVVEELQARLESLEQEMQEQARIIGMGAERELALVAKVEFLEKRASQALIHLAKCLDQVYSGEVDHDLEHLADHARADASILSEVDLDVKSNKGE